MFINPVAYVVESMTPVHQHHNFLLDLKIKNHMAMNNLTHGKATRMDMEELIVMGNVVEALYRMGFGQEYKDVVQKGLDSLHVAARRGVANGYKFILNAEEMTALNALMELHDAQMEVINVRHMEQAMKIIDKEHKAGKMRPVVEKNHAHG